MRRLLLVFALAALTAAAVTTAAFAKEGGVELSSTPFGLGPAIPGTARSPSSRWTDPRPRSAPPSRSSTSTPERRRRSPRSPRRFRRLQGQSYVFTVVFPTEGRYRYTATDGVTDREYEFPIVRIVGSSTHGAHPQASTGASGGFPSGRSSGGSSARWRSGSPRSWSSAQGASRTEGFATGGGRRAASAALRFSGDIERRVERHPVVQLDRRAPSCGCSRATPRSRSSSSRPCRGCPRRPRSHPPGLDRVLRIAGQDHLARQVAGPRLVGDVPGRVDRLVADLVEPCRRREADCTRSTT